MRNTYAVRLPLLAACGGVGLGVTISQFWRQPSPLWGMMAILLLALTITAYSEISRELGVASDKVRSLIDKIEARGKAISQSDDEAGLQVHFNHRVDQVVIIEQVQTLNLHPKAVPADD